jgi:hypothetical protein
VKAILNSKSYYFPLARLLLGLYDYRLKHISIFNYNNDHQHDQAHNNQSRGRLLFQEREDDTDIPTDQTVTQVDEHSTPINTNQGPITRSRAKKLQQEVNSLLAEINFNISENVILPKCLHWLYLGIYVREVVQLYMERKQRIRNKWISSDKEDLASLVRTSSDRSVRTCSDLHNDLIITLKSR